MTSQKQTILAFDAYGTLLSTESIAKQLASHFDQEKAGKIAQEWRKYQLEYTWRLNSMGTHYRNVLYFILFSLTLVRITRAIL